MNKIFKKASLSTLFAFMALFSLAQFPEVDLAPVNLDSVTTSSVQITGQQQTGSGLWFSKAEALNVITNVWAVGGFIPHQGSYQSIEHTVNNLGADSDYVFRVISSYDTLFSVSDTDYTEIVHTKPLANPVDLFSVVPLSLLPKSGFKFTGESIGQQAFAFGLDAVTFQAVTDTVLFGFTTSFTDTVFFLSDSANMPHTQTRFYVRAIDGSSYKSMLVAPFSSPANTPPVITNDPPVKTPTTFHVTINVTSLGNGGNSNLAITINDTTGTLVYQKSQLVTATGVINVDTTLASNRWHHLNAIITNQVGLADTISFSFLMPNVVNPSVIGGSGAFGFNDLTAIGYANRNGTSDSSDLRIAYLLRSGVPVDSIVAPTSDTLVFHEINQPLNTNYTAIIKVINNAGLSGTSLGFNVQTTPVVNPIITNNVPVNTQKLVFVGLNIGSLGNSGYPELKVRITDAVNTALMWDTIMTVTATGLINVSTTNVTSNHWYNITATLYNSLGVGDSVSFSTKTLNVAPPSATATVTTTFTDYIVTAAIATNGTYDSSAIKKVRFQENGVWIDSLIGNSSLANFPIYQRTPGATYQGKIEVTNLANLVYTTNTFNIVMGNVSPNGAPTFYALYADDASTLRITNIQYHATGSITTIRILREDLMTGIIDTFTVVTGVSGNGSIPFFTMTDCIGGHIYEVTVFDENQYGTIVWGYYDQQTMPAPEPNPVVAGITKDVVTNSPTVLAVKVFGSTEGNLSILRVHAYENNVEIAGSPLETPPFSGLVEYWCSWDGRTPNTQYKVTAELIGVSGGYHSKTVYISTEVGTGIKEVEPATPGQDDLVQVVNYLGQTLVHQSKYLDACHGLRDQHRGETLMFRTIDKDGLPTGETYLISLQ